MSSAQLTERARQMILDQIKGNIDAELQALRSDRDDPSVVTEPPRSYFIFDEPVILQCPAVIIYVDSGETNDQQVGPNHVNATLKVMVSVVVEAREASSLTIKAERYQSALFKILHWKPLVDQANQVKLWVRVARFKFSPTYTKSRKSEGLADFRKEVALDLEVKHYENPTI